MSVDSLERRRFMVEPGWATFADFVGRAMIRSLPYRRRGWLLGPKVCEYGAIPAVVKTVFFIGAALALADKEAAEIALANISGFGDWTRSARLDPANWLDRAMKLSGKEGIRFWDIYGPDIEIDSLHAALLHLNPNEPLPDACLLNQKQCVWLLSFWVKEGLQIGYLLPATARTLLTEWPSELAEPQSLGAKLEVGSNYFVKWRTANPGAFESGRDQLQELERNERFVASRSSLIERYQEGD